MRKGSRLIFVVLVVGVLLAIVTKVGRASQDKASVPAPQDKTQLRDNQIKQLLLLMDTDKNGKISKQEWMNFMSAEFDRLDTDKSGELDPKELAQSRIAPSSFSSAGK